MSLNFLFTLKNYLTKVANKMNDNFSKSLISFILAFFSLTVSMFASDETLLTRAEKSNYTETTRYEEVLSLLNELQKQSSNLKVISIGKSTEGRDIPLVILGDPAPASPTQLFMQNKPAIYVQANIHAGEVEGKEAVLMLMREILTGSLFSLLENQVILITPILNPDGNEKISTQNRTRQHGPTGGVGLRYNGQNLDLNRDYIKVESPENAGAFEIILNRWDPILLIDLHTTNGSYHQEPLTYAVAHNPNSDPSLPEYLRNKLLQKVSKELEAKYNILSIPYGYFSDSTEPEKGWRTFNHMPFYSTNYWGLRNRFAILNENYSYANYKTRIEACYRFVQLILEYTNNFGTEMLDLIRETDRRTIKRGTCADTLARFGIEFEATPFEKDLLIQSYEFEPYQDERGRNRVKKTENLKNYQIPFYANFKTTKSIALAKGYFFSSSLKEIAFKIHQHGITIEQLTEPITVEVQTFQVSNIKNSERIYQGHKWTKIEGSYKIVKKEFPAGTYYVGMDQPLANVAAYLLEPESDCGLVYWNFFDRYLRSSQWGRGLNEFPVYRVMKPMKLAKECVGT